MNNSRHFAETKLLLEMGTCPHFSGACLFCAPFFSPTAFLCLNYSETLIRLASHLAFNWYDHIIYMLSPLSFLISH